MAPLTPMMQQYLEVKQQYPDAILMFRLGDFYEMFFEDAKTASRELELVLTGRDCGQEERARVILKALEDNARAGAGPAEIPDAAELPEEEENPLLQISIAGNTSAEIMEQLKNIDVNTLTPIEALTMLNELVRKAQR